MWIGWPLQTEAAECAPARQDAGGVWARGRAGRGHREEVRHGELAAQQAALLQTRRQIQRQLLPPRWELELCNHGEAFSWFKAPTSPSSVFF